MLNIKIIFFFIIDFLKAIAIVLEFIMNELINYSIILNGQNKYFWLRYLSKDLIQAWVSKDKLNEILESKLDILL